MRISHKKRPQTIGPIYRHNQGIRVPEVRVIDENDQHLGVLPVAEAIKLAHERGFDLVEINPKAVPPIAQITNFTQFKYQKEKEARKQKAHQKRVEVKGVRLSLRIGEHDLEMRRDQTKKFLDQGDKARIEIILKGREKQHGSIAQKIITEFVATLEDVRIEQPIQRQAGVLSMVVAKS